MFSLEILNFFSITFWTEIIFYGIGLWPIILTLATLSTINPINSVIGLILILIVSAILLIEISINVIGMIYIIIYVGAIAILFLFVVMMMNVKYIELKSGNSIGVPLLNSSNGLAILISTGLIIELVTPTHGLRTIYPYWLTSGEILWEKNIVSAHPINLIGNILYTNYILWLIIISLILILAMMSPIILSEKK